MAIKKEWECLGSVCKIKTSSEFLSTGWCEGDRQNEKLQGCLEGSTDRCLQKSPISDFLVIFRLSTPNCDHLLSQTAAATWLESMSRRVKARSSECSPSPFPGLIDLTVKSESEKTRLLESFCSVVRGPAWIAQDLITVTRRRGQLLATKSWWATRWANRSIS